MILTRKVRYRPLHNGVLIKEKSAEEKTKGGIILPDSAKKKMNEGFVCAVGPGAWHVEKGIRLPMDTKVGDEVTWQQYGGTEIKVDGEDYILVRESEINGVLDALPAEPPVDVDAIPTATLPKVSLNVPEGVPEVNITVSPDGAVKTDLIPHPSGG